MNTRPDSTTAATSTLSPAAGGLERLLTVGELSEYLGVPVATIYDWRVDGKGPRAVRVGRRLRFAVGDVRAWLASLRENEPGGSGGSATSGW